MASVLPFVSLGAKLLSQSPILHVNPPSLGHLLQLNLNPANDMSSSMSSALKNKELEESPSRESETLHRQARVESYQLLSPGSIQEAELQVFPVLDQRDILQLYVSYLREKLDGLYLALSRAMDYTPVTGMEALLPTPILVELGTHKRGSWKGETGAQILRVLRAVISLNLPRALAHTPTPLVKKFDQILLDERSSLKGRLRWQKLWLLLRNIARRHFDVWKLNHGGPFQSGSTGPIGTWGLQRALTHELSHRLASIAKRRLQREAKPDLGQSHSDALSHSDAPAERSMQPALPCNDKQKHAGVGGCMDQEWHFVTSLYMAHRRVEGPDMERETGGIDGESARVISDGKISSGVSSVSSTRSHNGEQQDKENMTTTTNVSARSDSASGKLTDSSFSDFDTSSGQIMSSRCLNSKAHLIELAVPKSGGAIPDALLARVLSPTQNFTQPETLSADKSEVPFWERRFNLRLSDGPEQREAQWQGLKLALATPGCVLVFHLKNHYAIICGVREIRDEAEPNIDQLSRPTGNRSRSPAVRADPVSARRQSSPGPIEQEHERRQAHIASASRAHPVIRARSHELPPRSASIRGSQSARAPSPLIHNHVRNERIGLSAAFAPPTMTRRRSGETRWECARNRPPSENTSPCGSSDEHNVAVHARASTLSSTNSLDRRSSMPEPSITIKKPTKATCINKRQVLCARKSQKPKHWIDFNECMELVAGSDTYGIMLVRVAQRTVRAQSKWQAEIPGDVDND